VRSPTVGRRQYLDQHARLLGGGVLAEDQRIEEGELVSADARHRRMGIHRGTQPHRDLHKNFVSGPAAEQIVDRLEAVEVQDAYRKGCRIVGAITDQAIDLVIEPTVIAKARQGVREREFRALSAGIAVRKNRPHFDPACCHSESLRNLPAKRLGNVSSVLYKARKDSLEYLRRVRRLDTIGARRL
jgi:hypothetical protein